MNKKMTALLVFSVLFAGGSTWFALSNRKPAFVPVLSQNTGATSTPSFDTLEGGISVSFDTNETVQPSIEVPDLNRAPLVASFVSDYAEVQAKARVVELQTALRANPLNFDDWIELGLTFSSVGDYEAALEAYTYASALRPQSFLPLANMGFVYGWYLKQPSEAERLYKQALVLNPVEWHINAQLFELYRDVMNDPVKARAFANERIEAEPSLALDFRVLLADLDRRQAN